jgi:hypothetical protein
MNMAGYGSMLLTMMLSGATKTLTEKPTHTQPRMTTRFCPAERSSVRRRISPNTPTFRSSRIFAVNSCTHVGACTRQLMQLQVGADVDMISNRQVARGHGRTLAFLGA